MSTDMLQIILRALANAAAGYFVAHGWMDQSKTEAFGAIIIGIGTTAWSKWHLNKALNTPPPNSTPPPSPGGTVRGLTGFLLVVASGAVLLNGCSAVAPGNDPLIVRAEQTQTTAKAGFDSVLTIESANYSFWRTNVPGFFNFCEWLKQPQALGPKYQTNSPVAVALPRCSAMLLNLDDVKLDYKASLASSNALYTVIVTVESAANQAAEWLMVATNAPVKP